MLRRNGARHADAAAHAGGRSAELHRPVLLAGLRWASGNPRKLCFSSDTRGRREPIAVTRGLSRHSMRLGLRWTYIYEFWSQLFRTLPLKGNS